MKTMALLVMVQQIGGAAPEIEIYPTGFFETELCQTSAQRMNEMGLTNNVDPYGRPIISNTYKCLLVNEQNAIEKMRELGIL